MLPVEQQKLTASSFVDKPCGFGHSTTILTNPNNVEPWYNTHPSRRYRLASWRLRMPPSLEISNKHGQFDKLHEKNNALKYGPHHLPTLKSSLQMHSVQLSTPAIPKTNGWLSNKDKSHLRQIIWSSCSKWLPVFPFMSKRRRPFWQATSSQPGARESKTVYWPA